MKIIQKIGLAVAGLIATMTMQAQETYQELEQLTVNEEVTTVITASESIRFWIFLQIKWRATSPSTTPSG